MNERLRSLSEMLGDICGTAARQAIAEVNGVAEAASREVETLRKQAKTILEYFHGGYVPDIHVNDVVGHVGGVVDANSLDKTAGG